jgi:hypothetical protein
MKKKLLICGSICAIIVLILASFSPVVGYQSLESEDELVKVTTDFCGLGKRHTVQLTQREAEELDVLFDSIREKLDNAETREETVEIFNEAIVEIDKYGLLGGLSIEQALLLVTSSYKNYKVMNKIETLFNKNQDLFDNNSNFLCLVSGQTDITIFLIRHIGVALILSFIPIFTILGEILGMSGLFIFPVYYAFLKPLAFGNRISLGTLSKSTWGFWIKKPSNGWLHTIGLNGIKNWNGSFYGQIPSPFGLIISLFSLFFYTGIIGFTGIRILSSEASYFYMGTALWVNIGPDAPEFPWLPE